MAFQKLIAPETTSGAIVYLAVRAKLSKFCFDLFVPSQGDDAGYDEEQTVERGTYCKQQQIQKEILMHMLAGIGPKPTPENQKQNDAENTGDRFVVADETNHSVEREEMQKID